MKDVYAALTAEYRKLAAEQEALSGQAADSQTANDPASGERIVNEPVTHAPAANEVDVEDVTAGKLTADERILSAAEDSTYFRALDPDRLNAAEVYPWDGTMKVLVAGAGYGAFAPLAARVQRLDIIDPSEERLELIRLRYPVLTAGAGQAGTQKPTEEQTGSPESNTDETSQRGSADAKLRLLTYVEDNDYDAVIVDLAGAGLIREFGRTREEYLRFWGRALKPGGSLLLLADNLGALRYAAGDEPEDAAACVERFFLDEVQNALGFAGRKVYYPLPNAASAINLWSDTMLPGTDSFKHIAELTPGDRTAVFDEDVLYGRLVRSGVFADFAPSYIAVYMGAGGQAGCDACSGEILPDAQAAHGIAGHTDENNAAAVTDCLPDYVRCNRRRAAAYAIKTEVYLGAACTSSGNAQGFVRKKALSESSNQHILSFETKYNILKKDISTTEEKSKRQPDALSPRLVPLRATLGRAADGLCYADFPYIHGIELGKKLAGEIRDGKAPIAQIRAALELIVGYATAAPGGCLQPAAATPAAKDTSADVDTGIETASKARSDTARRLAVPCHNLDALFENILIGEDGAYHVIDYEWVSEEPVDRGFLTWRILTYWFAAYAGELSAYRDARAFLSEFGITPSEDEAYKAQEAAFQEKVRGNIPYGRFLSEKNSPADIKALKARLDEFTEWNLRLQDEVAEHKEALSKERETERLSQNHIRNIEKINDHLRQQLEAAQAQNVYLQKHQSLISRVVRRLVGALDAWAPAESRKRKLLHYAHLTLRHPFRQGRLYFTAEGRRYLAGDLRIGGEFAEGGLLELPYAAQPLVSIVIPAYNQVAYTYACIRSILQNTDFAQTPYEVILADDVSTDATAEIGNYIGGLVISRNSANMGFLKNCNQAAARARGAYIFFLNNDTKVHAHWLDSLLRLMEADETIGMAGSKLVYPDGRLQEAGGIIWSDASGWNYGRLDDPDKPEYNYVKDVDYISGAAIMIRTSLWQEIGGFDERFAPAYCEDSDLAFEVRRHGRRVVYQPQSVVTHFEGISNGTDVQGTGLKRYQLVNQEKFREKWAEELAKQEKNTGNPDPFTARDRSQGKPCVAIIDHYVPTWDRDAGSKTTYQYIRMFLKMGFQVKFIGDNFLHEEPYSSALMQLGVEILYGAEYQNGIYEYLQKNSSHIDFCYLNRPHIAVKYIDFLKKHTDIKCIFYGHDLHYLRILREYELTGDVRKKRESDYWRSLEYSVMEQADMVYYPSQTEIDEIHKFHPEIPARAITAYVWEDFPEHTNAAQADFAVRRGMLFVGGFKHPPNADAVKWFAADILPKIREALPEAEFYVAGSGAGEEILTLENAGNGIHILGFVSDERLQELYETTRLIVAPLRYGAGVKGKIVEALYNRSVVITTSVGAEGIPDAENIMTVVDDDPDGMLAHADRVADAFAEAVIRLYRDPERCARMSAACAGYMRKHYSIDAAWAVIAEDFRHAREDM